MKVYIGLAIVIFLALPLIIYQFFMNKFITNWDMEHWSGFLGSYLGGGISGVITLVGVWWQVTREDKKKKQEILLGVLKYFHHILEKNISLPDKSFQRGIYHIFSYNSSSLSGEEEIKILMEFNQNIIINNLNSVYKLKYGEDLYELNDKILEFNKDYGYLFKNLSKKKKLLKKLEFNGYVHTLELLSNLIYNLSNQRKISIEYNISTLKQMFDTIPISLQGDISKIVSDNFQNSNIDDQIKLVAKTIIIITEEIQKKMEFETEISSEFMNYRIKENRIYQLNIYEMFEKMDYLLEKIEEDIKELEKK